MVLSLNPGLFTFNFLKISAAVPSALYISGAFLPGQSPQSHSFPGLMIMRDVAEQKLWFSCCSYSPYSVF